MKNNLLLASLLLIITSGQNIFCAAALPRGTSATNNSRTTRPSYGQIYKINNISSEERKLITNIMTLINNEIDVNKASKLIYGEPALFFAVSNKYTSTLQLLLDNDTANIDEQITDGKTALIQAALHNRTSDAKRLLNYGANPNLSDKYSRTALKAAVVSDNIPMTKALLAHGANADMKAPDGMSALDLAYERDNEEITRLLLASRGFPKCAIS